MLSARHLKSALAVGVIATLLFGGCGLKGPLYRSDGSAQPGDQPNSSPAKRKKNPFSRIPAPQAQKQDQKQKQDGATPPPQPSDPSTDAPTDAPPAVDPDRPATPTPIPTP
jgi:predicted small lipoprotein YifL